MVGVHHGLNMRAGDLSITLDSRGPAAIHLSPAPNRLAETPDRQFRPVSEITAVSADAGLASGIAGWQHRRRVKKVFEDVIVEHPALSGLVWIALIFGSIGPASAQEAQLGERAQCSVRHSKGTIKVVICPPGLDQNSLRAAGQKACGVQRQCNAWIWESADKAPKDAPAKDADIDPKSVGEAVAVWANDSHSLMMIERVPR